MNRMMMVFAMALLVAVKCTQTPVAGGGASETVAMVEPWSMGCRILIADDSGGVRASVCHELYSPDPSDSGRYHAAHVFGESDSVWLLPELVESTYAVIIADTFRGTAIRFNFDNRGASRSVSQSGTLKPAGRLSGSVALVSTGGSTSPAEGYTVYLRGTLFSAVTGSDGVYLIERIPEGFYSVGTYKENIRSWSNAQKLSIAITGDSLSTQNLTVSVTN